MVSKIKITKFKYQNLPVTDFEAFFDNDFRLILFPSLFSYYTEVTGSIYKIATVINDNDGSRSLEVISKLLGKSSVSQYLKKIKNYLSYVENKIENTSLNIHLHENTGSDFINEYINYHCIKEMGMSYNEVIKTISALKAYYNFLFNAGITEYKKISIWKENIEVARDNTKKRRAIKYIPERVRSFLLQYSKDIKSELLIRCGYELGTRSKECQGLMYDDFTYAKKPEKGIKSLISEMIADPEKMEFKFLLKAKYTKARAETGGQSRILYINRLLLMRFKDYVDLERPSNVETPNLFLKTKSEFYGEPIAKGEASAIFAKLRTEILNDIGKPSGLSVDNTYHHLRHSFGTDKFYDLSNSSYRNVGADSAVMIQVAELLGHSIDVGKGGRNSSLEITRGYIRSCREKEELEQL